MLPFCSRRGRSSHPVRHVVAAVTVAAVVLVPARAVVATPATTPPRSPEYVIKAAYLYNFALFVEWPGEAFTAPDSPLVIGIVGANPFGSALERTVAGKRINKRRIVIEPVQGVQDARHCHILFISADDAARLPDFTARLEGAPVLVVTEGDESGKQGWAVRFTIRDNKVAYDINVEAATRARLAISSKLLHLARVVRE